MSSTFSSPRAVKVSHVNAVQRTTKPHSPMCGLPCPFHAATPNPTNRQSLSTTSTDGVSPSANALDAAHARRPHHLKRQDCSARLFNCGFSTSACLGQRPDERHCFVGPSSTNFTGNHHQLCAPTWLHKFRIRAFFSSPVFVQRDSISLSPASHRSAKPRPGLCRHSGSDWAEILGEFPTPHTDISTTPRHGLQRISAICWEV